MLRQNEIAEILTKVDSWSPEDRVALAYQILRDMRSRSLSDPPRRTADVALGMGRTAEPPLTDQQVEELMANRRTEKYG
jgi:hypothetical protein